MKFSFTKLLPFNIHWSIRKKLWAIFFHFVFIILINIWNVMFILYMQKYDAANLKNIGLLNTLSVEYEKELYKAVYTKSNSKEQLLEIEKKFTHTFKSLKQAPDIFIDLIGVRQILFKNKEKILEKNLQELLHDWNVFLQTAKNYTGDKVQLEKLTKQNKLLRKNLQHSANLFQQNAEHKIYILKIIQFLIFLGSILTFIIALLIERKAITGPIVKLTDFARKLSSGKLGAQITINTKDEISTLAKTMNYSSSKLDKSFKKLSVIQGIGVINIIDKRITEILQAYIDIIVKKLNFSAGAIYLLDYKKENFLKIIPSQSKKLLIDENALSVSYTTFSQSLETGKPTLIIEKDILEKIEKDIYAFPLQSIFITPIFSQNNLIGFLEVVNIKENEYKSNFSFFNYLSGRIANLLASREKIIQINEILEFIPDGILTINMDKTVNVGYSKAMENMFNTKDIAGKKITDFLQISESEKKDLMDFFETAFKHHKTDWTLLSELNPLKNKEILLNTSRLVKIAFRPVYRFQRIWSILLSFTDLTEKKELENRIQSEKRRLDFTLEAITEISQLDPAPFLSFISESLELVQKIQDTLQNSGIQNKDRIKRYLHTLKADAAAFNLNLMSKNIHELESSIIENSIKIDDLEYEVLKIEKTLQSCNTLVAESKSAELYSGSSLKEKLEKLRQILQSLKTKSGGEIQAQVSNALELLEESIPGSIKDYIEQLSKTLQKKAGSELNKKLNPISLSGDYKSIPERMLKGLKEIIIHIIRNALDHGIETFPERIQRAKPEAGTISVKFEKRENELLVEIKDDGRGLDLEKIKMKAFKNSIASPEELNKMSKQQLYKLIFRPDFSTKEESSQISGRGMGMNIVMERIKKMKGKLKLKSTEGKGTKFSLYFPL